MVRFEKDKLVIEVTCYDPVERWMELHTSLCDIIRNVAQENIASDTFYSSIDFLSELIPGYEECRQMKKG